MLRKDFVAKLSEEFKLPKSQTDKMIGWIFESITEILLQNDEITFPGFGKFKLHHKKARHGRNPRTGEKINIKATVVPVFKPAKALKETIAQKIKINVKKKK